MNLRSTNFSSISKQLQRRHCLNKNSPSLIYEADKENSLLTFVGRLHRLTIPDFLCCLDVVIDHSHVFFVFFLTDQLVPAILSTLRMREIMGT